MTKKIFLFICATLLVGIALYTPTTSIFNHNNVYAATKKAKIKFNKTQKKLSKKQENMLSLTICLKIVSLKN